MPFDPFFSSKVKNEQDEIKRNKVAYAKAFQFGFDRAICRKTANSPECLDQKLAKMNFVISPHHKHVNGYRRPHKKWSQIRTSHDPHEDMARKLAKPSVRRPEYPS